MILELRRLRARKVAFVAPELDPLVDAAPVAHHRLRIVRRKVAEVAVVPLRRRRGRRR